MLVDLSVPIAEGMPQIPFFPEVTVRKIRDRAQGDPLEIREMHLATHVGTHLDAPRHRILGGKTVDQIPLEAVCGSAVCIPIQAQAGQAFSLAAMPKQVPTVERGDIVLFYTGWDRYYGTDTYHDNPYPETALAEYLVATGVKMIGIDAITVDVPTGRRPPGFDYPVHQTLLAHDILILENLTNLAAIVGQRVWLWAFPLKIAGADAGHVRVVAQTAD